MKRSWALKFPYRPALTGAGLSEPVSRARGLSKASVFCYQKVVMVILQVEGVKCELDTLEEKIRKPIEETFSRKYEE